jgi:hypothetical protein
MRKRKKYQKVFGVEKKPFSRHQANGKGSIMVTQTGGNKCLKNLEQWTR